MSSSKAGRSIVQNIVVNTTGPRKRRSRLGNVPSLKEFVHKTTVLRQYRDFLKAVRLIPDDVDRKPVHMEVRDTFRKLSYETDELSVEMAIKDGERRLKQVQSMVGHRAATKDADSWLNIDDQEDPRGRVGVEWPWQKK
mmetsp:Transcript_29866/g.45804  ORF Transcript_29866/g.45804 Transcript_29866/m.45804 type:complete len:139 (-) Transcript_29866:156-572(-)